MSIKIKRKRLFINLAILIFVGLGTAIAIKFAKGYQPDLKKRILNGTGLLAVSSYPKQAQVLVNDRLTTTTDDTLYLKPDSYHIKIIKEGFHSWQKDIPVQQELVSIASARLFPIIPSTSPLTFYFAQNTVLSSDGTKIAFVQTNSAFDADDGLYVLSLDNSLLGGKQLAQITDQSRYDYTKAQLLWSPDNSQILAIFVDDQAINAAHLLESKTLNSPKNIKDVTVQLPLILSQWQEQLTQLDQTAFNQMPDFIQTILLESSINVYFSPDQQKVIYTPTKDLNLEENLIGQKLPNINSTSETRQLTANQTYVYNLEEGTNYHIPQVINYQQFSKNLTVSPSPTSTEATQSANEATQNSNLADTEPLNLFQSLKSQTNPATTTNTRWYPDSNHLILTFPDKIQVIEYDSNNLTTLIETNIIENFSTPSPDGNRLIFLTNLNQKQDQQNLISIDLK